MSNGSLEKFAFRDGGRNHLWPSATVFNIPPPIARVLDYVHQGCNERILQLDIKTQTLAWLDYVPFFKRVQNQCQKQERLSNKLLLMYSVEVLEAFLIDPMSIATGWWYYIKYVVGWTLALMLPQVNCTFLGGHTISWAQRWRDGLMWLWMMNRSIWRGKWY